MNAATASQTTPQGIHHVTLLVDDAEQAAGFYGDILGLEQKDRPRFNFRGLFYYCGSQEIHLIVASRRMNKENLYIEVEGLGELTKRHIHRHAALVVADVGELERRLVDHGFEVLFSANRITAGDALAENLVDGWMKMYGAVPVFCCDPFGNLLEFIPGG